MLFDSAPDKYHYWAVLDQLNEWDSNFKNMPIWERAQRIAYKQLTNIKETLEHHDRTMKRRIQSIGKGKSQSDG